jgi:hypothetical protein
LSWENWCTTYEKKVEEKEFQGESSPDPGISLSYARTDHFWPSKNEQNEQSFCNFEFPLLGLICCIVFLLMLETIKHIEISLLDL